MSTWTLTETHPTQGRIFHRPLDPFELNFIWDGHFNGTADTLHPIELRLLDASRDAHLFSDVNIVKAWLSTKRRHPLVGATVHVSPGKGPITHVTVSIDESDSKTEDEGGTPTAHFIVREHDLAVLRPHEIVFGQVACAEEVSQQMAAIASGPRPLSDDLLVRLYVFRETDPQRTDVLHLIVMIAHCVADGTGKRTLMRCLVDTLARSGEPDLEPVQIPLEERLAMLVPLAHLIPMHVRSLSPAIRRWRQAVGAVIFQRRMAKFQGGQTLPCRRTRMTRLIAAQTGFTPTLLSEAQTATVLANCRLHGLTFGNAYLVLGQVAMTRVLYRRYLRGEIPDEEWEYRKRQPYLIIAPVNLRRYLDESWYSMGGGGEFLLSFDVCFYRLPFMTLGGTTPQQYREQGLPDGAPPFSDLLTFDQFLHRAGLVKKQTKAFVSQPLALEITQARVSKAGHSRRILQRDIETAERADKDEKVLAASDMPVVIAHLGSNLGNLEMVFPTEYPLPPTHPLSPFCPVPHPARAGYLAPPPAIKVDTTPRMVVENIDTMWIQTRPGELYLGTWSSRGRLNMFVCHDRNVYEDGMVREWLDEVRQAVLWYLGESHRPCDHDTPQA